MKACNAINCIRNLPVKSQAPISSFNIERTCHYAKDDTCKVQADWSPNFTPVPKVDKFHASVSIPRVGLETKQPGAVVG
jgi:hypothetical protein